MFSSNSASPSPSPSSSSSAVTSTPPGAPSASVIDQTTESADHAIQAAQRVAADALDSLANALQALRAQAEPLLDGVADETSAVVHRGMNALHDRSRHLRASARQASDSTVGYIQHEPVKSMLIAAATGAALMGLVSLMRNPRDRG
jgi:ElaB/YqjD/DUF883 family membrane-anchored ribosome-binding protein